MALLLIGGLLWFYSTGGFSQLTQHYEQSPTVGLVGTLVVENPEGAEITLHSVLATRVYEPVAFEEMPVRLRRGDYFVEARKGGQTLRYPVYIAGRGHRVRLTVEFPTTSIPDGMAYIPAGWFLKIV